MAPARQKLVIVESPTKAKTIRKFLGKDYRVEASMGHVRDLPASADQIPKEIKNESWARIGVDVDHGFQPVYIVQPEKKKVVSDLKKALEDADVLYVATDEDREGESIGWHLVQVLKPKVPIHRMVFHEITEDAIQKALSSPRAIDEHLVQAQETRRVLDRLVGYTVSPLLWKKVKPKLSAGRVQSVAVRLLVLRERERMAFVSGTYWDVKAEMEKSATPFESQLVSLGGVRLATGKDFDETTGKVSAGANVLLLSEAQARDLEARLKGKPFKVVSVETRSQTRSPAPPFTTSTLQQEANRKLGLSARRTMQVAQRLYENGFITYMRTDSTNLSEEAITAARSLVSRKYGNEFLSEKPRQYSTKSKGAQEAHEAIRPAGTQMPTADELKLDGPEHRLYDMIWKRTVATQMAEAKLSFTTVKLEVTVPAPFTRPQGTSSDIAEFRASGKEVVFPGFFRAYVEGNDDTEDGDDKSSPLPAMKEGDNADCKALEALGHETKPPARYTEATLVKALEKEGIGRPSTYASIIDTIQQRGYVLGKNKQLIPTFIGMAVTRLLEESLKDVVDLAFTAAMEVRLDEIAEGKSALEYLDAFYKTQLLGGVAGGAELDAKEMCTVESPRTAPYVIRVGRYGPYVDYGTTEEKKTVSLPEDTAPADVTKEYIDQLIAKASLGNTSLGNHPESSLPIYLMHGRYGHYVQLGEVVDGGDKPKRTSIPANVDPTTMNLEKALQLLALPRTVGEHPETGKVVKAGIGMYGPYVLYDRTYASLKAEDDVLTVSLDRAIQLINEKRARFGGQDALRELGDHPEDKKPVKIMSGRYGPYIKWNRVNASLPEGVTAEEVTMERAVELLAERAGKKGGKAARGGKKAAAPKAEKAEKAPAKKKTTKKAAAKTASADGAEAPAAPAKKAAPKMKVNKKKAAESES